MDAALLEMVKASTSELLAQLQIESGVSVIELEGGLLVTIETADPGILIGYHGRNLEAIQLLLGQIVFKKHGEWVRLTVTVGDYRERREKQLHEIAEQAAAEVSEQKEAVYLSELTPQERRIVHLALQDHPEVITESEGEGKDRRLVVKPRA